MLGVYLYDYLDIELIGDHYVYKIEYVDNDVDAFFILAVV